MAQQSAHRHSANPNRRRTVRSAPEKRIFRAAKREQDATPSVQRCRVLAISNARGFETASTVNAMRRRGRATWRRRRRQARRPQKLPSPRGLRQRSTRIRPSLRLYQSGSNSCERDLRFCGAIGSDFLREVEARRHPHPVQGTRCRCQEPHEVGTAPSDPAQPQFGGN